MMRVRVLVSFVMAVASVASVPARATVAPEVRITSPEDGAFVTGVTMLRAHVEPANLASSVVFFVDGLRVCTNTKPPFECEWDAGPAIAARQVRLVVNLAAGGRIVHTTRTAGVAFAETVDVDVVQVTVTVMDDQGHYVKGLPRSAFHVSEDGKPQSISHFYAEDAPLQLVVAIDISGSMESALPTMKRAVADFLSAVPTRHQVTLLGFNDDVFSLARSSADPADRAKTVGELSAWGSTALYESILRGVEILGSQPGRKALVVFSDGEDQGSHVTVGEVEQWLQASDLILYMIGQGQGVVREPLKKLMDRLSRPTGGRAISTNSIEDLHDSFNELLEEMSNQYVLGYQPAGAVRDDTWHDIKVNVDGHERIRARQGYRTAARR